MSSASDQKSYVESILNEVLGEVSGKCLDETGDELLSISKVHGSGFLGGAASLSLSAAAKQAGQEREYSLTDVALLAILAVVADRMADADDLAESEPSPKSPVDNGEIGKYFDDLLSKIAAAPMLKGK